jgi:hypothetical protein
MSTKKIVLDEAVWDEVGRNLFPVGIPPKDYDVPQAVTKFIGGYPDGFEYAGEQEAMPIALIWNHDFTPAEDAAWDRLLKTCRRRVEYDDQNALDLESPLVALKKWKADKVKDKRTNAERDETLDALVDAVRGLLIDED